MNKESIDALKEELAESKRDMAKLKEDGVKILQQFNQAKDRKDKAIAKRNELINKIAKITEDLEASLQ